MLTIIISIVVPMCVLAFNLFSMRNDFLSSLRNTVLTLALIVIAGLPVGEWETRTVESSARSYSMICVAPCQHNPEHGGVEVRISPLYTSLFASVFTDDDHMVEYCPECYTRTDAIAYYVSTLR